MSQTQIAENIIKRLHQDTYREQKWSQKEEELIFDAGNARFIDAAIIKSDDPAEKLQIFINLLYHHGFDWGYPENILSFFKLMSNSQKDYGALKEVLQSALYLTKFESLNVGDATNLVKTYFPIEEQEKFQNFLANGEKHPFV